MCYPKCRKWFHVTTRYKENGQTEEKTSLSMKDLFPLKFSLNFHNWEANFNIVSLAQSPQSSDHVNCACDHFLGSKVQCTVFEAVRWLLLSQKEDFFFGLDVIFRHFSQCIMRNQKSAWFYSRGRPQRVSKKGCMRGFRVKDQGNVSFRVWLWLVWHREVLETGVTWNTSVERRLVAQCLQEVIKYVFNVTVATL